MSNWVPLIVLAITIIFAAGAIISQVSGHYPRLEAEAEHSEIKNDIDTNRQLNEIQFDYIQRTLDEIKEEVKK